MTRHAPLRITRREALRRIGAGVAAVPLLSTLGCAVSHDEPDGGGSGSDSSTPQDGAASFGTWATGGTAAMTDAASYPDPFTAAASACVMTCQATIGPCHTTSPERADVSDGWDGIPVRLALRVLDEACQPLEDAIVEIWHTNYRGVYSGQINAACNEDEVDRQAGYFRGYQRTSTDGRVDFDTVFPGWYSGRCVHIHFRIMAGTYDAADGAAATLVSQLFFSDALVASIFQSEPLYADYGQPDTTVATDGVVGGEDDPSPYVCDVAQMTDGAMLASKTIIVRSSSASVCSMQGSGMGGPM